MITNEKSIPTLFAENNARNTVYEMIDDFTIFHKIKGINHLINKLSPLYEKYYYSYKPGGNKPLFTDIVKGELSQYFQSLVEPDQKTCFQKILGKLKNQQTFDQTEREPTQIAYMLNMTNFDELIANIEARIKDYSKLRNPS